MSGIIGQDPRGKSGLLNQLSALGIGTSSPTAPIHIQQASGSAAIQQDRTGTGANLFYNAIDSDGTWNMTDGGTARLSINSSGDIYSTGFTAYQDSASIAGFSQTPSTDMIQYKRVGFLVYFWFYIYGPSHPTASAGEDFSFNLPYAASSVTDYRAYGGLAWSYDNSALDTNARSFWQINSGSSTVLLHKNNSATGWTNAGNKGASGHGVYQANSI